MFSHSSLIFSIKKNRRDRGKIVLFLLVTPNGIQQGFEGIELNEL